MKNPNGYGCVYKLPGKRRKPWAVIVTTGKDYFGNQKREYLSYHAKREDALIALAEYQRDPELYDRKSLTLEEVYNEWKKTRFQNIADKTIESYENAWKRLYPLSKIEIILIKKTHIQNLINSLEVGHSAKRHTRSLISQLMDHAMQDDIINKNYAYDIEIGKLEKKTSGVFTEKEIQILWENKDKPFVDSILFLIYTGRRIGEVLNLKKFQVDLKEAIIKGGNKTEAGKNKITPIHASLIPIVTKRYRQKGEYLFSRDGAHITADYYRKKIYYPLLSELGIQKITPHRARHTFATLMAQVENNKVLIQKLMGHTSYKTTADLYTHAEITDLKTAINKLKTY